MGSPEPAGARVTELGVRETVATSEYNIHELSRVSRLLLFLETFVFIPSRMPDSESDTVIEA